MVENGALCPSVTSTFANDLESNEARLWTQLQAQTRSHSSQHMIFRYFDEAQASLCKFADSSESSLTAEILILIALSSNYTCTNVQTHWSESSPRQVVDEHAPLKEKVPKPNSPPYMNSRYRKIIYKTRQARNSYNKNRTRENWKNFTILRNLKTKVKRESISMYFLERCGGGPKSKDFWPTIKPFLSQKSTTKSNSNIILKEDDNLISDQSVVCEKMNDFYINIAKNIGIEKAEPVNKEHPSIKKISENIDVESFNFRPVTEKQVSKCIKKLDTKKQQG